MAASLTSTDLTLDNTSGASIPGTPSAGQTVLYPKDDKLLYYKDDAGVERSANINSGTVVATTSGTSIDFTGIPAGVKRITVMFNGVSTNGTSNLIIRVGSGSILSSGYAGNTGLIRHGGTSNNYTDSTAFIAAAEILAANNYSGAVVLNLIGTNVWSALGNISGDTAARTNLLGGVVPIGAQIDRLRLTTVNGTDAFDLGSVNISWEF
jgi:hypothetical protein